MNGNGKLKKIKKLLTTGQLADAKCKNEFKADGQKT